MAIKQSTQRRRSRSCRASFTELVRELSVSITTVELGLYQSDSSSRVAFSIAKAKLTSCRPVTLTAAWTAWVRDSVQVKQQDSAIPGRM